MSVTRGHYLEFVSTYVSLLGEKRDEIEGARSKLSGGLAKLEDCRAQVRMQYYFNPSIAMVRFGARADDYVCPSLNTYSLKASAALACYVASVHLH